MMIKIMQKQLLPSFLLWLVMCFSLHAIAASTDSQPVNSQKEPLNVVIFLIDDLRADLGIYGSKHVKTPNIDQLAREGVRFNHAYSQQALCAPSRVSIMTGMRPETLGIYHLGREARLRLKHPNVATIPQLFKANGYKTISLGKVYHSGVDDKESWTTYIAKEPNTYHITGNKEKKFAYEAAVVDDLGYKDGRVARDAVNLLSKLKDDKFMMVVGFSKPHLPFNAPKKYWDLYNKNAFDVPSRDKPDAMFKLALTKWKELRSYGGIPEEGDLDDDLTRTLIQGYYASVSYVDAQVGKVMAALDAQNLRDNTLVVFMSDHGYKLGEYGAWNKHTNMELDARVPLIISRETGYKNRQTNKVSDALVENIDVFPTILDAAGLPKPVIDGKSLLPLIDNPNKKWDDAAYSLHSRGKKYMGVSVTDGTWRYTQWRESNTQKILFTELYLHKDSDIASANVSGKKKHKKTETRMMNLLYKNYPLNAPSFNDKRELGNNMM